MALAMAIYRDGRAFALGVVGGAALLATMAGEYLMHNPAQAQDFRNCPDLDCLNKTGTLVLLPYPATAVVLPDGSTLNITLYQVIVLALGALIFASALACAKRTTLARRIVPAVAAVLLALTLMFFRTQAPVEQIVTGLPSCNVQGVCSDHQQPRISTITDRIPHSFPALLRSLIRSGTWCLPPRSACSRQASHFCLRGDDRQYRDANVLGADGDTQTHNSGQQKSAISAILERLCLW